MANSRRRSPFRILSFVALFPLFVLAFVIVMNLMALSYYVNHVGSNLLAVFERQSAQELAAGRVVEVAHRLYGSLVEGEWSCIRVSKNNLDFLDERRDPSCDTGFLGSWAIIDSRDRGGIKAEVLFVPSTEQKLVLKVVTGVEVLMLAAYTLIVLGMQRRAARQAFELETTKLREQAIVARATQMLAHDVRRPFQLVRSLASLVGAASGSEAKELLDQCLPEVERALVAVDGLVEDVLSANSELRLQKQTLMVGNLLSGVLGSLRAVFLHDVERVQIDSASSQTPIYVDVRRFSRVIANLIANAIEAAPQSANLWVSAEQLNGFTHLTVGNAGSYIGPAQRKQLFQDFYTSGKAGGTGLGLAIAKRIVKAHKGTIRCESRRESESPDSTWVTEFHIVLPSLTG